MICTSAEMASFIICVIIIFQIAYLLCGGRESSEARSTRVLNDDPTFALMGVLCNLASRRLFGQRGPIKSFLFLFFSSIHSKATQILHLHVAI